MARANPGRVAAARALIASERGSHIEDVLAEAAPDAGPDRGLAWHLALGVLRRRGALERVLAPHVSRGLHKLDPAPRVALMLGAFEVCLGRTPAHAAVSQAVEVCRATGGGRAAGLVNAVMRKVRPEDLPDDPLLDLPPWLADRWSDHTHWVRQMREPAVICGVWRDAAAPVEDIDDGPVQAAGQDVPGAFKVGGAGDITLRAGFAQGHWWVMDPAAVMVADLAVRAAQDSAAAAGRTPSLLDACAAPGGKTLRAASLGVEVMAVDLDPVRLDRLRESATRVGIDVVATAHDWLKGPLPEVPAAHGDAGGFDAVLVDAPCTGLGTVRRHPEIRWRRLPSDPAAMALRQRRIARAAATHVAPGGALVYAVCSPFDEEGAAVVADLEGWQVVDTWSSVPPQGDEDAHQAFVLRRTETG